MCGMDMLEGHLTFKTVHSTVVLYSLMIVESYHYAENNRMLGS